MSQYEQNKNMLFISHAWEDFEITRWLALQLANKGYGVWCDLTKLLGGENWPLEINEAIQNRTEKFIFILSKDSNAKDNPLGELELALNVKKKNNLKDFIIPIKVDDLEKDKIDFRMQNMQWIDFSKSWKEGLDKLSKLLAESNVSKNIAFDPTAVNFWWNMIGAESISISKSEEQLDSNRFKILNYPKSVNIFVFENEPTIEGQINVPIIRYNKYLISFNSFEEINVANNIQSNLIETVRFDTDKIIEGKCPVFAHERDAKNQITRLFNQSFEMFLSTNVGLQFFNLSNNKCYHFNHKNLEKGKIYHTNNGELSTRSKLWGKKGRDSWHFGISSRCDWEPELHFLITPHIILNTSTGLRAASASVTKQWRNNHWRNRMRATMLHLSEDEKEINILNTASGYLKINCASYEYISPVSYIEPTDSEEVENDE